MRFLYVVLFACLGNGIFAQIPKTTLAELEARAESNPDTLYIYNFWATWCRPCVEEMPHFDQVSKDLDSLPVQVVFVSLDLPSEYGQRLPQFLKKRKFHAQALWLDEPKIQTKIDLVSPEWSGAIPATLFIRKSQGLRKFHEGDYSLESLRIEVLSMNP